MKKALCPKCNSSDINLTTRGKLVVYECKNCKYVGQNVIELDKLKEQKERLMKMQLNPKLKREIDSYIQEKTGKQK
mgnify:FL=1